MYVRVLPSSFITCWEEVSMHAWRSGPIRSALCSDATQLRSRARMPLSWTGLLERFPCLPRHSSSSKLTVDQTTRSFSCLHTEKRYEDTTTGLDHHVVVSRNLG